MKDALSGKKLKEVKKKKKAENDPIESFDYELGFSIEEVYD